MQLSVFLAAVVTPVSCLLSVQPFIVITMRRQSTVDSYLQGPKQVKYRENNFKKSGVAS